MTQPMAALANLMQRIIYAEIAFSVVLVFVLLLIQFYCRGRFTFVQTTGTELLMTLTTIIMVVVIPLLAINHSIAVAILWTSVISFVLSVLFCLASFKFLKQ